MNIHHLFLSHEKMYLPWLILFLDLGPVFAPIHQAVLECYVSDDKKRSHSQTGELGKCLEAHYYIVNYAALQRAHPVRNHL